ncbi:hypothetical protein HSX11_09295 [Oxalobacteraceae bacterium]|nr:hypothetical protein [Oxalobacteraceae bacterium]
MNEAVGAPDGDMGTTINELNDAIIEEQYLRGVEDARAAGEAPVNYYVAGSGNTQIDADERAAQAANVMGGTWQGIEGGAWFDNVHQLAGTGIGNTAQTAKIAYALGRCQDGKIITHSQGDLSTLTAINRLREKYPQVLNTKIISMGSPLKYAYTENAVRVTGKNDPIQNVRGAASIAYWQEIKNCTDITIDGGHDSANYMENLGVVKSSLAVQSQQAENCRE